MSILDNEERILNNSDWVIERTTIYGLIDQLMGRINVAESRLNDLENKNAELRAELDFIKRNITISKPAYQQDEYCPNIGF